MQRLTKAQHQPFCIFRNQGVNCRTIRWRMICRKSLYTMETINESTCCRVYQITWASIKPSISLSSLLGDRRRALTVYNHVKIVASARYKVGDLVCVNKFKTVTLIKVARRITMIFKIIIVQQTNPLTYLLENSCGELKTSTNTHRH